MNVHFSASSSNLRDNIVAYKKILRSIRAAGHTVGDDWVEDALLHDPKDHDSARRVRAAAAAIQDSEVIIAEVSESSFGVGYEIAVALHQKKPLLLLYKEQLEEPGLYALGLENELITYQSYSEDNLAEHVAEFLRENDVKTKDLRFNFVIDRKIYNHLRLKSFRTGKTKAEVLRDLLIADIDRD